MACAAQNMTGVNVSHTSKDMLGIGGDVPSSNINVHFVYGCQSELLFRTHSVIYIAELWGWSPPHNRLRSG